MSLLLTVGVLASVPFAALPGTEDLGARWGTAARERAFYRIVDYCVPIVPWVKALLVPPHQKAIVRKPTVQIFDLLLILPRVAQKHHFERQMGDAIFHWNWANVCGAH